MQQLVNLQAYLGNFSGCLMIILMLMLTTAGYWIYCYCNKLLHVNWET